MNCTTKFALSLCAFLAAGLAPAFAEPPGMFNWSGFYIGANGGVMSFKTSGTFVNAPPLTWDTAHKETGIAGLHGGFQMQSGNLVYGIEGAWSAVPGHDFGATMGAAGLGHPCGYGTGVFCQARIKDILQVGPRVGFAMGNWMPYVTGGYANAEIENRAVFQNTVFDDASNRHSGWYAGGGLDLMMMNHLVLGLEYKHYDFASGVQSTATPDIIRLKANADTVSVRLTIK